jgi:hypothetical protein
MAGLSLEMRGKQAGQAEGYQKTRTGADGTYRFEPTKLRTIRVYVEAPGHVPYSREIEPCPWGATILNIPLRTTSSLFR